VRPFRTGGAREGEGRSAAREASGTGTSRTFIRAAARFRSAARARSDRPRSGGGERAGWRVHGQSIVRRASRVDARGRHSGGADPHRNRRAGALSPATGGRGRRGHARRALRRRSSKGRVPARGPVVGERHPRSPRGVPPRDVRVATGRAKATRGTQGDVPGRTDARRALRARRCTSSRCRITPSAFREARR
jgi:hypothetical protein